MNSVRARVATVILATLALVSLACAGDGAVTPGGPTATPPVGQPGPNGTPGTKLVLAPIDDLDVLILESFPVQYRLSVKSGLPDSCARFDSYKVERGAESVRVTIYNRVPTGRVACAQLYRTVEHSIAIGYGDDYVVGTTVTVLVNDRETTFVAQ